MSSSSADADEDWLDASSSAARRARFLPLGCWVALVATLPGNKLLRADLWRAASPPGRLRWLLIAVESADESMNSCHKLRSSSESGCLLVGWRRCDGGWRALHVRWRAKILQPISRVVPTNLPFSELLLTASGKAHNPLPIIYLSCSLCFSEGKPQLGADGCSLAIPDDAPQPGIAFLRSPLDSVHACGCVVVVGFGRGPAWTRLGALGSPSWHAGPPGVLAEWRFPPGTWPFAFTADIQ